MPPDLVAAHPAPRRRPPASAVSPLLISRLDWRPSVHPSPFASWPGNRRQCSQPLTFCLLAGESLPPGRGTAAPWPAPLPFFLVRGIVGSAVNHSSPIAWRVVTLNSSAATRISRASQGISSEVPSRKSIPPPEATRSEPIAPGQPPQPPRTGALECPE